VDLVGSSEVAEMLGVSKQTLVNWRNRADGFPEPVANLKSGPVWEREAIVNWAATAGVHVVAKKKKQPAATQRRDAVVVAVVNMKGGVGKSTVTANLGWHSSYKKNHKVLLVDLDPQFNLSQYALGSERYEELVTKGSPTIYDIFEQTSVAPSFRSGKRDPKKTICAVKEWSDGSRLDIVPSQLELSWTLKNSAYGKTEHLKNFLSGVRKTYDLILIDCPPTQSMLTDAAYASSDYVLIPVKPEFLSTIGLPLLIKSLEDYQIEHPDHEIEIAGILFNAVLEGKAEHQRSRADVMTLAKKNNWYVFKNEISYSDSYPKGSREGKPIFLTDYARWNKVSEFDALANEFIERIGL
jgi:chromosome partitioning protein